MHFVGRSIRCLLAVMLMVLFSGCGGMSGSHSVSPATFFLPGLGQVGPGSEPQQLEAVASDVLVAQVH